MPHAAREVAPYLLCGVLEHGGERGLLRHAETAEAVHGMWASGGAGQPRGQSKAHAHAPSRVTYTLNGSLGSDVKVTLNVTLAAAIVEGLTADCLPQAVLLRVGSYGGQGVACDGAGGATTDQRTRSCACEWSAACAGLAKVCAAHQFVYVCSAAEAARQPRAPLSARGARASQPGGYDTSTWQRPRRLLCRCQRAQSHLTVLACLAETRLKRIEDRRRIEELAEWTRLSAASRLPFSPTCRQHACCASRHAAHAASRTGA